MLGGAGGVEGLDGAAGGDGDFVVGDGEAVVGLAGEVGVGFAAHDAVVEVDGLGRGFVVFDRGERFAADGLLCETEVEEAACGAGKEGRVLDGADGRDDDDVVERGRDFLRKRVAGPA